MTYKKDDKVVLSEKEVEDFFAEEEEFRGHVTEFSAVWSTVQTTYVRGLDGGSRKKTAEYKRLRALPWPPPPAPSQS